MRKFKKGDLVCINPTSRWVKQGLDAYGTPFIGKIKESSLSHGFYDYGVEWDYRTHYKIFYYNDEDLLPLSEQAPFQTNEAALFLLHKNELV